MSRPHPDSRWVWSGGELRDGSGELVAYVANDVITVGSRRLLIEHSVGSMRFRMRATSAEGTIATIVQPGWTVGCLEATCQDRHYRLRRTHRWARARAIELADGRVAALVHPRLSGDVEVHDGPAAADLSPLDAVILTWACVLIDSPSLPSRMMGGRLKDIPRRAR